MRKAMALCRLIINFEMKNFKGLNAFCDREGKINDELPKSTWLCEFIDMGNKTKVKIEMECETAADL